MNMKEIILGKFGEIVLKGANRFYFESLLLKDVKRRSKKYGRFEVVNRQSILTVRPLDDEADFDRMYEEIKKVFGLAAVSRAAVCEKTMADIEKTAREYIPGLIGAARTFKVESKRSDKSFPLTSPQISAEIGASLLDEMPQLKVDLYNPDIVVRIEVREDYACVHAGQDRGAGGVPLGSSGKGLLLLSGGIDSPVAGFMMAKRGVEIEALHFDSFPYTGQLAKEKVLSLAKILSEYCGRIKVHTISLTHIQEELKRNCDEDYFTLLLRRFMFVLAEKCARRNGCGVLITGESLGQVASQTMQAISVTDAMVDMPVFRPCIGLDKEEIVTVARRINTFDTSILPYEDCCTVFVPRHPRTRPEAAKVAAEAEKIDFEALAEEAFATLDTIEIG